MRDTLDKLTPGWPAKLNLACDVLLLVLAMAASMQGGFDAPAFASLALVGVVGWLIGTAVLRLYSPCTPRSKTDQLTLTLLLVVIVALLLFLWERIVLPDAYRFSVTSFGVIVIAWCTALRMVLFQPLRAVAGPVEEVIIVGVGPTAVATATRLARTAGGRRFRVVGLLAFAGEQAHNAIARGLVPAPILGRAADLLQVLEQRPVAEVYIAGRTLVHGPEMQHAVRACEEIGMPFALPVHALQFERAQLLSSSSSSDGYLHYISIDSRPVQHAVKRMTDIVCSAFALVVLSPLLATVALMIKLESPGPIFFKQARVGLLGAHFNLLKFRSMVVNADAMKDKLLAQNEQNGPVFKMKHDPRVTRIGRFIRKFSIDELPQLVNILRGDMTIVGPRPAVPREVAQYRLWQRRRLSVRPGLTCYWQVGGRNEIGFEEWMQLDLRYVDNWSLVEDIKLIAATVPVVLLGKGAS
ncbi:MAG: sugar transferase [Deltaproteobacteria bacterium]|nr:sugar transferase [Deltaproteobacteria bacterium]